MATNLQFSIAVHLMAGLGYGGCEEGKTSGHLARSVNTSASFVRRTMAKLSKAGLVETSKGKAGVCRLAKDASKISLLDIYRAVDAPRAFAIHSYKEYRGCPISVHIKASLERALGRVQKSMEGGLAEMSLADVIADVRRR